MQFFYDLSNLGNFYSFSVYIIFLKLFLVVSCTLSIVYFMQYLFIYFLFLSVDENSNIDIGPT